jgi:hypothetical protein
MEFIMLSFTTIKTIFICLEDNAWEDNIPTKQAVKSFLNDKSAIESFLVDYKSDLEMLKEDAERYANMSDTFANLAAKFAKDVNEVEKTISELTLYKESKWK